MYQCLECHGFYFQNVTFEKNSGSEGGGLKIKNGTNIALNEVNFFDNTVN